MASLWPWDTTVESKISSPKCETGTRCFTGGSRRTTSVEADHECLLLRVFVSETIQIARNKYVICPFISGLG